MGGRASWSEAAKFGVLELASARAELWTGGREIKLEHGGEAWRVELAGAKVVLPESG